MYTLISEKICEVDTFYGTLELWKETKIYSVGKRIPTVNYSLTKKLARTQLLVWRLWSLNLLPRVYGTDTVLLLDRYIYFILSFCLKYTFMCVYFVDSNHSQWYFRSGFWVTVIMRPPVGKGSISVAFVHYVRLFVCLSVRPPVRRVHGE